MNVEEAKEKIKNVGWNTIDPDFKIIDVNTVLNIVNQIELDQQKPEVSREVADWIETVKSLGLDLYELLEGPADNSLEEWLTNEDNQELIVKARLFGYTIKKEKLYIVEIPNPNSGIEHKHIALARLANGKLGFSEIIDTDFYSREDVRLTESEIRKDFDWAWREEFPKEVTE